MITMKRLTVVALALATLFAMMTASSAADPSLVYGKWIEKFANGNGIVTEYAPSSIVSYQVDPSGKRLATIMQNDNVSYKDLDGNLVGVYFQRQAAMILHVKDAQNMLMEFPSVGVHSLTRLDPQ
jgi:hypothetical protein